MRTQNRLALSLIALLLTAITGWAAVTTDYDHKASFESYKTYSWAKVQTKNSFSDERVKDAVNRELAAKGWTQVPSGGDVVLAAREATHNQHDLETFYDRFGGRRWGGFGSATTTEDTYKVRTLVIDISAANTKSLIWRGAASGTLSGNPEKNTKQLDKNVHKMFEHFPPKIGG